MPLRTAVEIAADGKPLLMFHRHGASAWTHSLDDPTFLTTGRHGAIVGRPCPICSRDMGEADGRSSERRRGAGAVPGERASP